MNQAKSVVVSIVCSAPDHVRFCRRMSADVNHSQLYLSRVMVTGRQVYPIHDAVLGNPDVLMRCEFGPRDVSSVISESHIRDVLARLSKYEVIEVHTVDRSGSVIERLGTPLVIGS